MLFWLRRAIDAPLNLVEEGLGRNVNKLGSHGKRAAAPPATGPAWSPTRGGAQCLSRRSTHGPVQGQERAAGGCGGGGGGGGARCRRGRKGRRGRSGGHPPPPEGQVRGFSGTSSQARANYAERQLRDSLMSMDTIGLSGVGPCLSIAWDLLPFGGGAGATLQQPALKLGTLLSFFPEVFCGQRSCDVYAPWLEQAVELEGKTLG